MKNTEDKCLTCGKELIQVPNKRKKLYCNTTCKSQSWYKGNKDKAKAWRDARKEDKADEKLKEELANDHEMTEILEEIVELKVGDKKVWNKAFEDARTYGGKKKKNVNLKNLNTPSKGTTQDLNKKETTNYPINTKNGGGKKESDYLASRRKLKS